MKKITEITTEREFINKMRSYYRKLRRKGYQRTEISFLGLMEYSGCATREFKYQSDKYFSFGVCAYDWVHGNALLSVLIDKWENEIEAEKRKKQLATPPKVTQTADTGAATTLPNEDINYMFYIKPKGAKRFSTYNPGKGTMNTGRVFTELYRKEHLPAVCKWIAEDKSGDFAYQLRSGDGKKIFWEYNPTAATTAETPQILNCEWQTVEHFKAIPNIAKLANAGIIINGVAWHTEYLDQSHNVLARVDNIGWHEDGKGFGGFQGSGVFGKTEIFESWIKP